MRPRAFSPWALAALRAQEDLSTTQLAARLDCRESTVASWERGACDPSLRLAIRLADVFQVKMEALFETVSAGGAP